MDSASTIPDWRKFWVTEQTHLQSSLSEFLDDRVYIYEHVLYCRFTAAIAKMLVQSTQNDLYLLRALPRDKWPRGCAKGLRARGDVTVNICWDEGELQEAMLWSKSRNSVTRLHYGGRVTSVRVCRGTVYRFNRGLQCLEAWPLGK
jgi:alpha-L-fucosidase 2